MVAAGVADAEDAEPVAVALAEVVADADAVTVAVGVAEATAFGVTEAEAVGVTAGIGEVSVANQSWYEGKPDNLVCVNVRVLIAAVGLNQPAAPLVSFVLPTSVVVPEFHVG